MANTKQPLLLLALEEYFRAPVPETLSQLYHAVNSMDLSLMPRLSHLERSILQASDTKDLFIEKFEQMIQQRMAEDAESAIPESIDASSPVKTNTPKYILPRDTHEFESKVYYNGIPVPIKVPTSLTSETVGDFSLVKLITTFSQPHTTSPQPFALHPHLTTSGAYTHPIIVLINALLTQKRIVFLGHNRPSGDVAEAVLAACALASGGMLRGFTRHAFPYTDLTKIDDLLKVPGFIAGVTNSVFALKVEWWDLLCDLETGRMKISHRIEGAPVTEGLLYFQQQAPNALINTAQSTSQPTSSSSAAANALREDPTNDSVFIADLLNAITQRHGENAIRAKFHAYISKFIRISSAFEELVYGASALFIGSHDTDSDTFNYGVSGHGYVWPSEEAKTKELAANVSRIEGWRNSRSYYSLVKDLVRGYELNPVKGVDLECQMDRLRQLRLSHDQSAAIYAAFAKAVESAASSSDLDAALSPTSSSDPADSTLSPVPLSPTSSSYRRTYDTILQLLTCMPESNSGLFYISLGLFHPKPEIRAGTVKLLERIRSHEAGRHFWASLGRFAKLAFFRVKRDEEAKAAGLEK